MGAWSLYFLVKTGLYYAGLTGFQWGWNLVLALCVAWPLSRPALRRVRLGLALPAGLALAYYESFLPKAARVWSQMEALRGFTKEYMVELALRFFTPGLAVAAVGTVLAYWLLSRRLRMATFAVLAIVSVPIAAVLTARPLVFQQSGAVALGAPGGGRAAGGEAVAGAATGAANPDARLREFYAQEAPRRVAFAKKDTPAFDILVLHICSLSWDDLAFVGDANPALLKRFDVVFRNFNSAASYSGPSSIRLLQGNCGQTQHKGLYEGANPECYVFPTLEQVGFKTAALLNHTGTFDNFTKALEQRGFAGKVADHSAATATMQAFDGSAIYDDYSVLSQWWKKEAAGNAGHVALYYNTITMHDGNRGSWLTATSSIANYKQRLDKLLENLDHFVRDIESSGRPVVLVLLPEHGASLRGDRMQLAGMREIPGPQVTLVPAAVKLIGLPKGTAASPVLIDRPTSYLGINTLLADFVASSPFAAAGRPLTERVADLPVTDFVAENDDVVVMRDSSGGYLMRSGDGAWVPYQTQ